jgi:hypothetical protein
MELYQSKFDTIRGSDYARVERAAQRVFNIAAHQTKRTPYIRSRYFDGRKVFLPLYWNHLMEKVRSERKRRMRYIEPGFDLVRNTRQQPLIYHRDGVTYYRFFGVTKGNSIYAVQVKEESKRKRLYLVSVFPIRK